jgi:predicted amidohydrolase YtcJ
VERAKGTYAFRSLLDNGVTLAFGSDWNVAPLNPIAGIAAAVHRQTLDGKHPNGWVPEQKITVHEAVSAYTVGSAYAEFTEKEKGKIQPGFLADLVVLSEDIFSVGPDEISTAEVQMTFVDGKIVFQSDRFD